MFNNFISSRNHLYLIGVHFGGESILLCMVFPQLKLQYISFEPTVHFGLRKNEWGEFSRPRFEDYSLIKNFEFI